jgi:hypothetical protein
MSDKCWLNKKMEDGDRWKMCCCKCLFHKKVNTHCTTILNMKELRKTHKDIGCVCGIQIDWACVPPDFGDIVFTHWGEHGCGCEMFTERKSDDPTP